MTTLIKPGYITVADLTRGDACELQVDLFRATFGDEVRLNKRNLAKAIKAGLDTSWCARFLSAPALAEYERVTAPAWAEYERVRAPAWAEHERVTAASLAEYERVRAAALFAALTGTPLEMQP